jgi:hypothetical protein
MLAVSLPVDTLISNSNIKQIDFIFDKDACVPTMNLPLFKN